jgi:predicted amidophosphoribosyltransferase
MALQHTYLSYNQQLYSHYYLCNYLPASTGRDSLSHSLLRFKNGRQPDVDAFIDCAIESFAGIPIPSGATIIRALRHFETTVSGEPSPLDLLGQRVADHYQHYYLPRLLEKPHANQPVKLFSKPRREEELQGLYRIDASYVATLPEPPGSWLIIDDVLTSGATLRAILHAINETFPGQAASADIFTLAKATSAPLGLSEPLQGQRYRFDVEDPGWTLAEALTPYYSILELKSMILRDGF